MPEWWPDFQRWTACREFFGLLRYVSPLPPSPTPSRNNANPSFPPSSLPTSLPPYLPLPLPLPVDSPSLSFPPSLSLNSESFNKVSSNVRTFLAKESEAGKLFTGPIPNGPADDYVKKAICARANKGVIVGRLNRESLENYELLEKMLRAAY